MKILTGHDCKVTTSKQNISLICGYVTLLQILFDLSELNRIILALRLSQTLNLSSCWHVAGSTTYVVVCLRFSPATA